MEETILQRIRMILKEKSISVNSLAKQISFAQATLNPQLRGDRALSAKVVEGILSAFPEVSAEWLLRGNGEMLLSDGNSKVASEKCGEDWKARYEELEKRYEQLLTAFTSMARPSSPPQQARNAG